MHNLDATVISQYTNSPVLVDLIERFGQAVNPDRLFEQFYDMVWNIQTAVGYGLDVWGRIVGIRRVLAVQTADFFGFTFPGGTSGDSFNAGIYYSGQPATTNYALTDDAYRNLILTKAAANITDGGIPAINRILMSLFPLRGNAFVIDNQDMTLTYNFDFALSPVEDAIVRTSGVMPTPAGVQAFVTHL